MTPRRIVVVGSANVDYVLDVDRRPGAGETVMGGDVVTSAGGKGANQAVAAARLGGDVAFVGAVGPDGGGQLLRSSLAAAGVDVTHLRDTSTPTGTALILLTPDGENSIVVSPGANRHVGLDDADLLEEIWPEAILLVVQLEIPLPTVEYAVRRASGAGVRVLVNAAPASILSPHVLTVADPLVVNESEARFLISDGRPEVGVPGDDRALATSLLSLGPRSVVLTLGSRGAIVAEPVRGESPRIQTVPAEPVVAVETTGAGDAFVGALSVGLAEGRDLHAAARLATSVAAVSVSRRGTQSSYPLRTEVWP